MTARTVPALLAVFTARRTWGELLYALLGLPLGVAGFVFTVTTISVSAGLLVTFIGLPLLAVTGLISRYFGLGIRRLGNVLLGDTIAAPAPFRARPGLFGWLGACLTDGTAWRARAYLLLKLPLGILTFVTAVTFWAYGLGAVSYPIWRPFLPCNSSTSVECHRGAQFGSSYTLDTPFRIALSCAAGVLLLLAAPWVVRGVVFVDRVVIRALLGPTQRDARVEELEHSRALAVDDAATTLRRIERDLHDGTQARLVSLAMNVGLAKEKLAEGGDPAEAERLLDSAHRTAKDAIAEVRDLARGIHPPVLDAGLDAALATLAANSAVPASLTTSLRSRPAPAIETIAYFCVAELLTNVAKHSGARSATVNARSDGRELVVTVSDNGSGGAQLGTGTGLAGLLDRVGMVDGTLVVHSPPGGPTVATIRLPLETQ
ncbi:MAG TPA: sensor domain-containing protein [Jatrophihabitantaceae bacterium]|nr:sensor domain-containing protein [Jatrophihabitantaceae bacterium]